MVSSRPGANGRHTKSPLPVDRPGRAYGTSALGLMQASVYLLSHRIGRRSTEYGNVESETSFAEKSRPRRFHSGASLTSLWASGPDESGWSVVLRVQRFVDAGFLEHLVGRVTQVGVLRGRTKVGRSTGRTDPTKSEIGFAGLGFFKHTCLLGCRAERAILRCRTPGLAVGAGLVPGLLS